jgi:hypothetical protein
MEKVIREFDSHKDADEADWNYYANLTTTEHLEHFLKLMEPTYAAAPGFQRVYRVAELSRRPVCDGWGVGIQPVRTSEDDG